MLKIKGRARSSLSDAMTAVGWRISMGWILIRSFVLRDQTKILVDRQY